VLANHGKTLPDADILALYGEFEAKAESGPYRRYCEVLESVVEGFAERLRFAAGPAELRSLHESIPAWPPFADTVTALRALQKRYKLAVISNIDDDLFAQTREHLGVEFVGVITAEQARSYKPSLNNFQMALRALAIAPERLLHVGQSIYHDVLPAQSLGMSAVWVNRKSARPGVGAVRAAAGKPNLEVPDLASLVAAAAA
jgi:2-haloacid dehalogenase